MSFTASDVKLACNTVLAAAFDGEIPVYGNDTIDGYVRPSFFTELLSNGRRKSGKYMTRTGFTFRITYFEETHDEAECLSVYETICSAFNHDIRLSQTDTSNHIRLVVRAVDYAWIDENADKLQVVISFYDTLGFDGYTDGTDLMESVEVEIESEVN